MNYLKIKRYIKTLCKDNIIKLCQEVGLSDYETKLIYHIYKNDTRIAISYEMGISEAKITKDTRKILIKIDDYFQLKDIDLLNLF